MVTKTYSFRSMPEDVYKAILKEQNRIKEVKGTSQFALEQTIYSIIREWARLKEEKTKEVAK